MKLHKINLLLWIFLLSIVPYCIQAQEVLTGISQNTTLIKASANKTSTKNAATAIKLPFVEDFSNYTGYPNPEKWADRQAFVNNTYPVYPPSIGVATLDALDENGRIYAHAERDAFHADTLTSQLIRLDSNFTQHRLMQLSDSLYLSFYYQPGGASKANPAVEWERIGDAPETGDKLFLDFGYATGNMIFIGFEYSDYIIEEGTYYVTGDTIENPFIPGNIYIFETSAFAGEVISMPSDSIFGPEYVWNEVWSTSGCKVDDWLMENPLQYFKQVLIPITDQQYLRNNFQFRFRNLASLDLDSWSGTNITGWASNCDQWHIDYIRLNVNRTYNDYYPSDVAFVSPTTTALSQYQAMPWHQYRNTDMAANFHNELANISSATKNTIYNYHVVKNGVTNVYTSTPNNENAAPYYNNGLHTYPYHAEPSIAFAYNYDNADSAVYTITHVFKMEGSTDENTHNDTCRFQQVFHNYYAYDDGTAEAGYSLLSTTSSPEAALAVQFTLAEPDTLRCVRFWFNSVLNDDNFASFSLMVWDDNDGKPGNVIYELPAQLPAHAEEYLDFISYYPEAPVPVAGTFYVGFQQNHNIQLNLGFDQNNDARGHFFYKTSNNWNESFYKGAPMVRPVVGRYYDHSGIDDHVSQNVRLYPNPTTGVVFINGLDEVISDIHYQITDIYGRTIETDRLSNNTIEMGSCAAGVYVIRLTSGSQTIKTEKIIKQ